VELVEVEVFGQKKVDLDLVLVNLELVNVYQIGPTSHLHIGVYQAHCVVH
jgi:hypothetical protein